MCGEYRTPEQMYQNLGRNTCSKCHRLVRRGPRIKPDVVMDSRPR
jgi:hypothetical protein